jgi:predicted GIY-YIG superfamily endonuclease
MRHSYVYIMTGRSDTLYTGVTSVLEKRAVPAQSEGNTYSMYINTTKIAKRI